MSKILLHCFLNVICLIGTFGVSPQRKDDVILIATTSIPDTSIDSGLFSTGTYETFGHENSNDQGTPHKLTLTPAIRQADSYGLSPEPEFIAVTPLPDAFDVASAYRGKNVPVNIHHDSIPTINTHFDENQGVLNIGDTYSNLDETLAEAENGYENRQRIPANTGTYTGPNELPEQFNTSPLPIASYSDLPSGNAHGPTGVSSATDFGTSGTGLYNAENSVSISGGNQNIIGLPNQDNYGEQRVVSGNQIVGSSITSFVDGANYGMVPEGAPLIYEPANPIKNVGYDGVSLGIGGVGVSNEFSYESGRENFNLEKPSQEYSGSSFQTDGGNLNTAPIYSNIAVADVSQPINPTFGSGFSNIDQGVGYQSSGNDIRNIIPGNNNFNLVGGNSYGAGNEIQSSGQGFGSGYNTGNSQESGFRENSYLNSFISGGGPAASGNDFGYGGIENIQDNSYSGQQFINPSINTNSFGAVVGEVSNNAYEPSLPNIGIERPNLPFRNEFSDVSNFNNDYNNNAGNINQGGFFNGNGGIQYGNSGETSENFGSSYGSSLPINNNIMLPISQQPLNNGNNNSPSNENNNYNFNSPTPQFINSGVNGNYGGNNGEFGSGHQSFSNGPNNVGYSSGENNVNVNSPMQVHAQGSGNNYGNGGNSGQFVANNGYNSGGNGQAFSAPSHSNNGATQGRYKNTEFGSGLGVFRPRPIGNSNPTYNVRPNRVNSNIQVSNIARPNINMNHVNKMVNLAKLAASIMNGKGRPAYSMVPVRPMQPVTLLLTVSTPHVRNGHMMRGRFNQGMRGGYGK